MGDEMVNSHFSIMLFYVNSDKFGKLLFIALAALSIISWTIVIAKAKNLRKLERLYKKSQKLIKQQNIASLEDENDPFFAIHETVREKVICQIKKNKVSKLSYNDFKCLKFYSQVAIDEHIEILENNLYILEIISSVAPLLGLLGTVWGILDAFSGLSAQNLMHNQNNILDAISMALSTTVAGLLVAIPSLVGYNVLKKCIESMNFKMEKFSTQYLKMIDVLYREDFVDFSSSELNINNAGNTKEEANQK